MDAHVKAGLLDLVDCATGAGWSSRRASVRLGLDEDRVARWPARRAVDRLADDPPGGSPVHGLLAWERIVITELFETWGEVDRSHRKLAHRGSRLDLVHVSESTVRRVLSAEGLVLEGKPAREPAPKTPWRTGWSGSRTGSGPTTFTHFTRARRAVVAVLDMVSRKWLATLCSPEETSTQVEVAFTAALEAEGLLADIDAADSAAVRQALACGDRDAVKAVVDDGQLPLLLAVSDNGPQMRSHTTREFLAGVHITQHFGRPHTPTDQAWIETLFGHVRASGPTWRRSPTPASSTSNSTAPGLRHRRWSGVHTPIKHPGGGQALAVDNQTYNTLHRATRCRGERGFALLIGRWRALRPITASPRRIGTYVKAALVLLHIEQLQLRAQLRTPC